MARAIEAEPERFDLSSIRVMWHMAAPRADWPKNAWIDLLGPEKIFELYGGTEMQAVTRINGTEWLQHPGSVGKPLLGEMVILDDDGKVAARGEVGEIFMRRTAGSPPTYRYIGAEAREVDGWEALGDLGWMDADGYIYISDRRPDMTRTEDPRARPSEARCDRDRNPRPARRPARSLQDSPDSRAHRRVTSRRCRKGPTKRRARCSHRPPHGIQRAVTFSLMKGDPSV